jgi:Ca2+-binding EF-hand superfamily protein
MVGLKHIVCTCVAEHISRQSLLSDDGSVSLQEFKDFFADGVLSEAELEALYSKIDANQSGSIDVNELCGSMSTTPRMFR